MLQALQNDCTWTSLLNRKHFSRALTAVIGWTSHFPMQMQFMMQKFTAGRSYFHIIRESTQDIFCNMDEIQQMRISGSNDSYQLWRPVWHPKKALLVWVSGTPYITTQILFRKKLRAVWSQGMPDQAALEGSSCTSIMTCTGGCGYSF